MTDIDIHAKTDRELLIMIVGKVNSTCDQVERISKWKDGNGVPGAAFQLRVMWLCFIAVVVKVWSGK